MIRYRDAPKGEPAIVVADPIDVHWIALDCRPILARKYRVPEREIPDFIQEAEDITCRALALCKVRAIEGCSAYRSLRYYVLAVFRNLARNYHRLAPVLYEVLSDDPEVDQPIDARADPIPRIEARELLARLVDYPEIAALLVAAASEPPALPGYSRAHAYGRVAVMRQWLRDVRDTGVWQEPPQIVPPRPRDRKKGR